MLKRSQQRGVTVIESMIALLVISVGLLGIAALQLTSMKQNNTALQNSKAVWIGYTMADRIRANVGEFENYAGIDTDTGYDRDCDANECTSAQMIIADADAWETAVGDLPSGRGLITGDATELVITVMWDDEGTGATGTGCTNDPDVDLTCYRITMVQ